MPRGRFVVRQAEVARALRAARATGDGYTVEITRDGTIRIVPPARPQAGGPDARVAGRAEIVL